MRALARALVTATACALVCAFPHEANSQARVDLDDLAVKGELLNDNRLRVNARESSRVQDRVRYRKDFRQEILDGQEVRLPTEEILLDRLPSSEGDAP